MCLLKFWPAVKRRAKNILIAGDQFIGACFGTEPDMTISAQAWLWHLQGRRCWTHRLIDAIFFLDREGEKRHCERSYESEKKRLHVPPEVR